jgi:hypothetical protein
MIRITGVVLAFLAWAACGSKSDPIRTYGMGERVQTGPLVYRVADVRWANSLTNGVDVRTPSNRFLLLDLSVSNEGATESGIPTLSLVDDFGKTHNETVDGACVPDWFGIVRRVGPTDHQIGNVAFDVIPQHYRLRVADETNQLVSYIDIPVSMEAAGRP